MSNSDLSRYAKTVYDHNSKLDMKDPHKAFLKEYQKLVKHKEQPRGDCPIGNYCGYGGCYRWNCCDMKDEHPKSKELAFQLERHKDQIGER